ncbi:MAG: GxxExxY protein [bacterium]
MKIILQLKAVDTIAPIYEAPLLTYMRLSGVKIGLIINFRHRFKSLLEKGEIGLHFLFSNRNTKKSQTGFQSGKRLFMFAAHIA